MWDSLCCEERRNRRWGWVPGFRNILRPLRACILRDFPARRSRSRLPAYMGSLMSTDAVANMRRFLGSRGGVGRQDALIAEEAGGPPVGDRRREARATYKKAAKQWAGQRREDGLSGTSGDKVKGDRRNLNEFKCRARIGNRRYRRDSKNHLAPKCPWRDTPERARSPPFLGRGQARKQSYSAMSAEAPFSPGGRNVWTVRRPGVNVDSYSRPHWMRGN